MLLILVTLAVTNPTLVTGALLTCPAPFMSRDMSLSPGCVTSTDSEISRDNILSLVTSSPRPQLCVSLCHTILEEVAMIGVLADPKNLRCWCLGSAPDEGNLLSNLYCDNECNDTECGGFHQENFYYSLYCLKDGNLTGFLNDTHHHHHVNHHRIDAQTLAVVQELKQISSEAVLSVVLLVVLLIVVLLAMAGVYHTSLKGHSRKNSGAPILNDYSKSSYGSNTFQSEGKSKFYNGEDLEELPEEDREGQSKFYRQQAVDTKTPEREGFSEIFQSQ